MTESAGRRSHPAGASPAERYLDDALYYLREGCEPCADRYFDRARRHGATEDQVEAVRAAAVEPAPPAG
jgi:hypothetical protein